MFEITIVIDIFVYTFIGVFLVNLIPVFGPPTWMVLSYIGLFYEIPSIPLFVLTALLAAVCGRFLLILFSKNIIRNNLFPNKYKKNMDYLRNRFENKPYWISLIFFIDAVTPLPSDQLFIAYGLTGQKARYALIPFALGRSFTYTFWAITSITIAKQATLKALTNFSFFSTTFILMEILLCFLLYFYVKIDWQYLIVNHRLRLINHNKN
jgi:hypothetical protein